MSDVHEILKTARERQQRVLSEYESKKVLAAYGIPVVEGDLAYNWNEVKQAASKMGYPVVLKACSPEVTHKTEKGLIEANLFDEEQLKKAFERMQENHADGGFLIERMIGGARELVVGMTRDPQFGPCVMFGLGGIFTEVLNDTTFRVAPIDKQDALEMMHEIRAHKILEAVRGLEAVDLDIMSACLMGIANIGLEHEIVKEIDVNPLIIDGNQPVAVDALVVLREA